MCHKCEKLGHYKSVCRSKFVQPTVRAVELENSDDNFYSPIYESEVSEVQSNNNKWNKSIEVNDQIITFEIDSGADVITKKYIVTSSPILTILIVHRIQH